MSILDAVLCSLLTLAALSALLDLVRVIRRAHAIRELKREFPDVFEAREAWSGIEQHLRETQGGDECD